MGIVIRSDANRIASDAGISRQDVTKAVRNDISFWNRSKGIIEIDGQMFWYNKIRRVMENGKATPMIVITG